MQYPSRFKTHQEFMSHVLFIINNTGNFNSFLREFYFVNEIQRLSHLYNYSVPLHFYQCAYEALAKISEDSNEYSLFKFLTGYLFYKKNTANFEYVFSLLLNWFLLLIVFKDFLDINKVKLNSSSINIDFHRALSSDHKSVAAIVFFINFCRVTTCSSDLLKNRNHIAVFFVKFCKFTGYQLTYSKDFDGCAEFSSVRLLSLIFEILEFENSEKIAIYSLSHCKNMKLF